MNLYTWLQSLDNKTLITYICIISCSLILFHRCSIILALAIAAIIILYLEGKREYQEEIEEEIVEEEIVEKQINEDIEKFKKDHIHPPPTTFGDKKDLIDFFFSIQDLYQYNPQAYEETINNIESFFSLYNIVCAGSTGLDFCEYYYTIAESKRRNSLNSLHSIIHNLPQNASHPALTDKLNRAHQRLNTIMTKYINQLYDMCKKDLLKNGYTVFRRPINRGPKEYNIYNDEMFSYDFY